MTKRNTPPKKGPAMASSCVDKKSATESLLEDMQELVETASKTMTDRQFKKAEKKFNDAVDRAVASRAAILASMSAINAVIMSKLSLAMALFLL